MADYQRGFRLWKNQAKKEALFEPLKADKTPSEPPQKPKVSSKITTKNTSIMNKKQMYAAPETEVLELRLEGVIAGSNVETLSSTTGEDFDGWDS